MITRREAIRLLGSAGAWFAAAQIGVNFLVAPHCLCCNGQGRFHSSARTRNSYVAGEDRFD